MFYLFYLPRDWTFLGALEVNGKLEGDVCIKEPLSEWIKTWRDEGIGVDVSFRDEEAKAVRFINEHVKTTDARFERALKAWAGKSREAVLIPLDEARWKVWQLLKKEAFTPEESFHLTEGLFQTPDDLVSGWVEIVKKEQKTGRAKS